MKTFAKFVLNDDKPVRMKNLFSALFVTAIAVGAVICLGALVGSFIFLSTEPAPFNVTLAVGLMTIGALNGVSTLMGIFTAIMKAD
jgi:ABC-type antimicrobial peptide transport system permease subunit